MLHVLGSPNERMMESVQKINRWLSEVGLTGSLSFLLFTTTSSPAHFDSVDKDAPQRNDNSTSTRYDLKNFTIGNHIITVVVDDDKIWRHQTFCFVMGTRSNATRKRVG